MHLQPQVTPFTGPRLFYSDVQVAKRKQRHSGICPLKYSIPYCSILFSTSGTPHSLQTLFPCQSFPRWCPNTAPAAAPTMPFLSCQPFTLTTPSSRQHTSRHLCTVSPKLSTLWHHMFCRLTLITSRELLALMSLRRESTLSR